MSGKKKLLIIGYGGAGSKVCAVISKMKKYDVTVLSPFDYMEISLTMTKAVAVGPDEYKKSVYPFCKEDGVNYVTGVCESITNNSATISVGGRIEFDVCLLATGQKIPLFMPDPVAEATATARAAAITRAFEQIQRSKTVVISGGGAIGTEVAADIKLRNKDKRIVLVHSQEFVLQTMNWGIPKLATSKLREMGIELIMNDKVTAYSADKGEVTLKSGKTIPCDMYIPAYATGGNCMFLPENARTPNGYANVDDTFKLKSFNNIFALGDCCTYDVAKTLPKIDEEHVTAVKNICAALDGRGADTFKNHSRGFMGGLTGPLLVAFGHGHPDGYGVGPDAGTGCPGYCIFCCCCCCQPPGGKSLAGMKNDFNYTVKPIKGQGIAK